MANKREHNEKRKHSGPRTQADGTSKDERDETRRGRNMEGDTDDQLLGREGDHNQTPRSPRDRAGYDDVDFSDEPRRSRDKNKGMG